MSEPAVDPWKGFRGVCAGTLVMQAIVILLVLTVIGRIDDGVHMVAWKVAYVVVLGVAMVVAAGLQRRRWAMALNLSLAALAIAGWIVHYSMGVAGVLFALVWAYLLYLRSSLSKRIEGGFLPSQHL